MASTVNGTPIMEAKLADLLEPAKSLLKNYSLAQLVQRQFYTEGEGDAFFVELDSSVPSSGFEVLFPELTKEDILVEGWKHIHFSIVLELKRVGLVIEGHYVKDPVPVDVKLRLFQGSSGYVEDLVELNDTRPGGYHERLTFKEILEAKLKSGDPKYAGPDDVYGEMSLARIFKVFGRFLRDWTMRHKFIEKD